MKEFIEALIIGITVICVLLLCFLGVSVIAFIYGLFWYAIGTLILPLLGINVTWTIWQGITVAFIIHMLSEVLSGTGGKDVSICKK